MTQITQIGSKKNLRHLCNLRLKNIKSYMTRLALQGDFANALTIHHRFTELFSLLFVDGNPAGVKAMLNVMGLIENKLRLPLVPTRITTFEKMRAILDELKIKC